MSRLRTLAATVVTVATMAMRTSPMLADPGNSNGNGNSGNHDNSGSKGNSGYNQEGHADQKSNAQSEQHKNYGKSDRVDSDVSYNVIRRYAVRYGLMGYKSLPPGIAENLTRGKPLPPGIARKSVPPSILSQLPYHPGYEWQVVGDNLVLIALSTMIVTTITNGVFD